MILNVSGRTDIVAFYTPWFMNRYNEGYLDVRNPFNSKLVSRINFSNVDLILFCTKNPLPIIDRIKEIDKPIIFHVTLTPYKKDIEPYVIDKRLVIEGIKRLSGILGSDNVVVRYDPIFLSDSYTLMYHIRAFDKMCKLLKGYVKKVVVSFLDDYKNVRYNMRYLRLRAFTEEDYKQIGLNFSRSALENGMSVQTCFEERNLVNYGFTRGECLSLSLAEKITGKKPKKWKARGKKGCNCAEMVDVGVYNTCKHFCKYCYANYDEKMVNDNTLRHDVNSSLLIGRIDIDDVIKPRV
ncbi:MAG: DUF1848 domain-containing protein [Bacilli bacterium]|nr:DUF1848 domain-containing protein [Bacilli bacterium]